MKISVAQLNPRVGDLKSNTLQIIDSISLSKDSDILVFPELFLTGYPPKDLLCYSGFYDQIDESLSCIVSESSRCPNLTLIVGSPVKHTKKGMGVYNGAIVIRNGEILGYQSKSLLPNYDVFDEKRYFDSSTRSVTFTVGSELIGIAICEDVWFSQTGLSFGYEFNPLDVIASNGVDRIVVLMSSPYEFGKPSIRKTLMQSESKRLGIAITYVNQVGGVDDLVFDGGSAYIDQKGQLISQAPLFITGLFTLGNMSISPDSEPMDELYQALCLGLKDYVYKSGFKSVLLGVSGGIDSALVSAIAVDALGSENVCGVALPSPYSSQGSLDDAYSLATNLGFQLRELPITDLFENTCTQLTSFFDRKLQSLTEENIQARLRGNLLMAISNQEGHLLLSTGNKSELAVGYCTLYGDMNGSLSPISDLFKTQVYDLSRWLNRNGERIPFSTLAKSPSAELRPDQKDVDTLPDYGLLDRILRMYLEDCMSASCIVAEGFDETVVKWIIRQVNMNEYKRFQSALGLKVSSKAFGFGRRMVLSADNNCLNS